MFDWVLSRLKTLFLQPIEKWSWTGYPVGRVSYPVFLLKKITDLGLWTSNEAKNLKKTTERWQIFK